MSALAGVSHSSRTAALLPLLLAVSMPVLADDVSFDRLEHITRKHGLSQDWVTKMIQDRQGFLWLGTADGLNRYDGYNFQIYRNDPNDPGSISDNFIIQVFEDRSGDLWVGTKRGLNRLDQLTGQFDRYLHDPDRPDSLAHDFITDIKEDRDGQLWIATTGSLNLFDRETGRFTRFLSDPEDPGSLGSRGILRIQESRAGDLWLGVGGWLHRLERDSGRFVRFPLAEEGAAPENVYALAEDAEGRLWVGTQEGSLIAFDPRTDELTRHPLSASGIRFVQHVFPRAGGRFWIGTQSNGLLIFDPGTGTWTGYRHDPDRPESLSSDRIMSLYEDRTGVIWIATNRGLDKLDPSRTRFSYDRHRSEDPNSLSADWVSAVTEDSRGDLWIGTTGGLNRLDRTGRYTQYLHDPEDPSSLGDDTASALLEDSEGILWIGTHSGIDRFDPSRGRFSRPGVDFEVVGDLQEGWIYAIVESEPGVLWIGGEDGINRLDTRTLQARFHLVRDPYVHGPETNTIYDLKIDRRGDLWVATGGAGLFRLRQSAGGTLPAGAGPLEFLSYVHDVDDPTSLSHDQIATIFEDRAGTLWIGTIGGGLNRLNRAGGDSEGDPKITFTRFREADGLANDNIMAMLEDDRGNLWLGSYGGVTRFDPRTGECRSYTVEDGLPGAAFTLGNAAQRSDGEFLFGTASGLIGFFPDRLKDDPHAPQVAITDFRLFNRSLPLSARGFSLSGDGEPRLTLSHRDAIFGFELAALHFAKPEKNRYAYRMEGFNDDWIETDARNRFAQYTNLDPGDYVFRVKASNADGVWNEDGASMRITVQPPPWKTWWAYSLYVLALAAMVLAYVRSHRRELRRERQVSHRLREVDKLKDEFLANTSHELRTPLYGITGLADSLANGARGQLSEAVRGDLSMIAESGQRLTRLVGDLLDFSKLRHESLELRRGPVDVAALAEIVLTLSRPLVGSKALELVNAVPADLPAADADEDRLQQILYNLVGNAIKFTESGRVEVSASAGEGRLQVRVTDTGIGIPEAYQERIFDAFEQADSSAEREHGGTGLGLAVTRKLVELHGGTIHLESAPGEGSTFSFDLPVAAEPAHAEDSALPDERNPISEEGEPPVTAAADFVEVSAEGPRVLVVDDEPVNLQVIRNYLAVEKFQLTLASSGEEALRRLEEESFDLVLLDIMMPRVSGYEVCRRLRESHSLSDLPVIFLTARTQDSDIVAGMALGANDYLTKPISKDRLLARMRPHLDLLHVHRNLEDLVEEKMSEVKVLRGLLPICAGCKKIRDDDGKWNALEVFIDARSEARFSHGLCPDCVEQYRAGQRPGAAPKP